MKVHVKNFDLKRFQKDIEKIVDNAERDRFFIRTTNFVANNVMAKAKELTPVHDYSVPPYAVETGRMGGTMRNAWHTKPCKKRRGDSYFANVANEMKYASYVNYGHRQKVGRYVRVLGKRLKKPFVKGQYMLENAEQEVDLALNFELHRVVDKYLKEALK